jgi:hypothetical protein
MNKLLWLGIIMSLMGCTQTTFKYYYVSLERVDGVEVVKQARLKLENLEKNSEIPTEYVLSRDRYTLKFLIGAKSYSPHLNISVNGFDKTLTLKHRRDMKVVSEKGNICASYYLNNDDHSIMDFGWSIGCVSDDIKKLISFDVVDLSGVVVAKEDLPFTVEHNGEYTLLDAL